MVKINTSPASMLFPKKGENPLVIAGPCSAETEEQMHGIAKKLAHDNRVTVLRAGIWKPRTRPNAFEGVGETALRWLVDAGHENGLPVTTEVANATHVEQALKAGVDVLWIGARTTVNPFSVQEIADALKGVKVPVLVKNPLNPDLMLWIGAMERISGAGIEEIGAIHRGFSPFKKTKYRNIPNWNIPIELKQTCPDIPLIIDPSHICGNRVDIEAISQEALNLNFSGLMIETHENPDKAWSDAQQQITPDKLSDILSRLIVRTPENWSSKNASQLKKLRSEIDDLDHSVIETLAHRMQIANQIGELKKAEGMTVLQIERWKDIFASRIASGAKQGLSEEFMNKFLKLVHGESIRVQNEVMKE